MPLGRYGPMPHRLGGSRKVERFQDALRNGLGSFLGASESRYLGLTLHAMARALWSASTQNERLSYLSTPMKLSREMIERWESILGIEKNRELSLVLRRRRIAVRFSLVGLFANPDNIAQLAADIYNDSPSNDVFSAIYNTTVSRAISDGTANVNSSSPTDSGGFGIYPGSHPADAIQDGWHSNVAYVAFGVDYAAVSDLPAYYDLTGDFMDIMDSALPAWATFDWFSDSEDIGFYLDTSDMDIEAFD